MEIIKALICRNCGCVSVPTKLYDEHICPACKEEMSSGMNRTVYLSVD